MKTGTVNTLLLITRDRLVRADLTPGRKGGLTVVGQEPRPGADDLPSLVEAALRLGTRRPGRVWLLSSNLWTQTLALPGGAVSGLRPEEIARALLFEAEPFSGINALAAVAAHVPLGDQDQQRSFWLTEIPQAQLEQIDYVVRQVHGQLAGISHPAGLPRAFSPEIARSEAWQRVELWPGAIVCIRGEGPFRPAITIRNADAKPGRWEADVHRWQAEQPAGAAVESLHAASAVALDELPAEHRLSLENPEGLARFLQAWAEQLATADAALPVLRPPQRPLSENSRRALAVGLGLAAAAICLAVHLLVASYQEGLIAKTARLREPAAQLAQLNKEGQKLQSRRDEAQALGGRTTADLAHYRQVMQSQRQRLSAVMTVLAACATDALVIRKIDGSEEQIELHGICLQPELASALAATLAKTLGSQSWHVQPPDHKSREQLAEGGPWEFDLRIKDSGPIGRGQEASAVAVRRPGRQP